MIKKLLIAGFLCCILAGFIFLLTSFYFMSFNPIDWSESGRFLDCLLLAMGTAIISLEVMYGEF